MKNLNKLNIFNIVIVIYVIIFKIVINRIPEYANLLNLLFWSFLSLGIYLNYRYPVNRSYLKDSAVRIAIINLLAYYIIINGLGLFVGFQQNICLFTSVSIIKPLILLIPICLLEEYVRYIFCKNCPKKRAPLYLLTLAFIILNIIMQINETTLLDKEQIFCFICSGVIVTIAKELLYSYTTYQVGLTPTLMIKLTFLIYPYLVPIIPALGDYLDSTIMLLFIYITYASISKNIQYYDKLSNPTYTYSKSFLTIPLVAMLVVLMALISGIFSYQLVTIGSNSMKGTYERGDAVIYKKIKNDDYSVLQEGMILVFRQNNIVITHRIIAIEKKDGIIYYRTKGDANDTRDYFNITNKDVLGYVTYTIPYIGYPSILLSEAFNK